MAGTIWSALGLGARPKDLGVKDGRLKRPSRTDNSVSSQAHLWPEEPMHAQAQIDPLPIAGKNGAATVKRLKAIVQVMPGATVIESRSDYLYAEFETPLMKYVDDVEFWYDPKARVVQVRSASRMGSKDFGANRKRVEAIRARLKAAA